MYLLSLSLLLLISVVYCKTKILQIVQCSSTDREEYVEHINLDEDYTNIQSPLI
jgi:hypothetical protein